MDNLIKYYILFIIHTIFFLYCIVGGLITNNKSLLLIHAINWPLTYIHWNTNKGACFLTNMENDYAKGTNMEKINKAYPLYTQRLALLFGIKTREEDNEIRVRILFTLGWLVSIYKLFYNQ